MTVWRVGVGDFRFKQNVRSPVTLQNVCHIFGPLTLFCSARIFSIMRLYFFPSIFSESCFELVCAKWIIKKDHAPGE